MGIPTQIYIECIYERLQEAASSDAVVEADSAMEFVMDVMRTEFDSSSLCSGSSYSDDSSMMDEENFFFAGGNDNDEIDIFMPLKEYVPSPQQKRRQYDFASFGMTEDNVVDDDDDDDIDNDSLLLTQRRGVALSESESLDGDSLHLCSLKKVSRVNKYPSDIDMDMGDDFFGDDDDDDEEDDHDDNEFFFDDDEEFEDLVVELGVPLSSLEGSF